MAMAGPAAERRRRVLHHVQFAEARGWKYPTVRGIADALGYTVTATHAALCMLEIEGLVEQHRGWGMPRGAAAQQTERHARQDTCGERGADSRVCLLPRDHQERWQTLPHTDGSGYYWLDTTKGIVSAQVHRDPEAGS